MNCLGTRVLHVLREFRDGGGLSLWANLSLLELLTLFGEFDGVLVCFPFFFRLFIWMFVQTFYFSTRFGTFVIF